jgi:hypothetical protein
MPHLSKISNLSVPFVELSSLNFNTDVSKETLNPTQEANLLNSSPDENILNKIDSLWSNIPSIRGQGFTWGDDELEILYKIMLGDEPVGIKKKSAVAALTFRTEKSCENKWNKRTGALVKFNKPWSESDTAEFEALMKKPGTALSNLENISKSFNRPFLECFAKWDELEKEASGNKGMWMEDELLILVKEMLNPNFIPKQNAENAAQKLENRSPQACLGQWHRVVKEENFLKKPIFKANSWSKKETREFEQIFKSTSSPCKEKLELTSEKLQRPFLECFAKWVLAKDNLSETDIENAESDGSNLPTKENIPPLKKRKITLDSEKCVSTHWKRAELEILFKHMTVPDTVTANMKRASAELKRSIKACKSIWLKHRAELETDKSLILKYGEIKCLTQKKLTVEVPNISGLDILAFAANDLKV